MILKNLPVFRRGLKCVGNFHDKYLSEWRDNLDRDDSAVLSHEVSIWEEGEKSKYFGVFSGGSLYVSYFSR